MFFKDPKKQDRVNIQLNAVPLPVRSPRHEQGVHSHGELRIPPQVNRKGHHAPQQGRSFPLPYHLRSGRYPPFPSIWLGHSHSQQRRYAYHCLLISA